MPTPARNKVLLRGEHGHNAVAIVESTMPAHAPGPPLHSHAFDEAFYILDGELTFQLRDKLTTAGGGELVFAGRGEPHTLANPSTTPARYLLISPRLDSNANLRGAPPRKPEQSHPNGHSKPIPEATYLGPRIGERR